MHCLIITLISVIFYLVGNYRKVTEHEIPVTVISHGGSENPYTVVTGEGQVSGYLLTQTFLTRDYFLFYSRNCFHMSHWNLRASCLFYFNICFYNGLLVCIFFWRQFDLQCQNSWFFIFYIGFNNMLHCNLRTGISVLLLKHLIYMMTRIVQKSLHCKCKLKEVDLG